MGNSVGKAKKKHKGEVSAAELSQPGQPIVTLASDRKSPLESSEVSDEVVLHWHPCTNDDKGYDIEMWDLGLQEWVHITTSEEPLCTLSNILSGILYRFRVTALTSEGGSSFPSDPSEPFVIDIPGVQVITKDKYHRRYTCHRVAKVYIYVSLSKNQQLMITL